MNTLISFQGYAPGAIRTREALNDLIIEARKGKKALRLYAVEQGGYFSALFITSKCRIEASTNSTNIEMFPVWQSSSFGNRKHYLSRRCLGDLNIVGKNGRHPGYNRHQLFSNRRCALEYSTALKNDAAYQQSVKDFHTSMNRAFGRF